MKTFFDASAFAKRFIEEPGSDEVERLSVDASELGLSVICVPEILSALNRRLREGGLLEVQYVLAKRRLAMDTRDADIIQLTGPVLALTTRLLERHTLRAMDAIHLACAIAWRVERFVSGDRRQIVAAGQEGLQVMTV